MRYSTMIVAVGTAIFLPRILGAQATDDEVTAVAGALPAIMAKVPPGPTSLAYWKDIDAALAGKLAVKLGKRVEHESRHLDCHGQTCALKGVKSLVNFTGVRVNGDQATVLFNLETPSNSISVPIEHSMYAVQLKREGKAWTVVRTTLISMS